MKIYSATTTVPRVFVSLEQGEPEPTTMLVPAGASVTAIATNDAATSFHLNYRDESGVTWDASVGIFQIELGGIVATVNEG